MLLILPYNLEKHVYHTCTIKQIERKNRLYSKIVHKSL